MRDLRAIGAKIVQVLHPKAENAVLRDWDLWGPLIVGLIVVMVFEWIVQDRLLTRARRINVVSLSCLPQQFCLTLAILLSTNGPCAGNG